MARRDIATPYEIREAANDIIKDCVRPHVAGGFIKGIDLTVCKKLLQLVPASHNQEVFGPKGEVGVDVGLPATYDDGKLEPLDWYCPEAVLT
ncbi:MAG: hypothetical protein Q9203_002438 [Teloschistes exilis]